MSITKTPEWRKLPVSLPELCINTTLRCGQSFRWRNINDEWICTLHGRILALKQDPTHLYFKVTWPAQVNGSNHLLLKKQETSQDGDDTEALLRHYFNLKVDLGTLYEQWSLADPNFRKRAPEFTGVRILNQDAWEALICFICSSNNNISRISQMAHKLCKYYGPLIGHVDGEALHDFPTPDALTGDSVESKLRELGFGYRAKYIAETARVISQEKSSDWLETLRNPENPGFNSAKVPAEQHATYKEAHEQLLSLKGVGPKVADCVCLMGLGWGESVPVDTHVWQIAQRDYKFGKVKTKTFSKAMYDAVGEHFRTLWGSYAGWAHSVLFTADLREFSDRAVIKKESQIVKIEEEVNGMGTLKPTKRLAVNMEAETIVEAKVKKEEDGEGMFVKTERRSKRLRTQTKA